MISKWWMIKVNNNLSIRKAYCSYLLTTYLEIFPFYFYFLFFFFFVTSSFCDDGWEEGKGKEVRGWGRQRKRWIYRGNRALAIKMSLHGNTWGGEERHTYLLARSSGPASLKRTWWTTPRWATWVPTLPSCLLTGKQRKRKAARVHAGWSAVLLLHLDCVPESNHLSSTNWLHVLGWISNGSINVQVLTLRRHLKDISYII